MQIPTNTCNFKIEFEVKHEAGHYHTVKFDWIKAETTAADELEVSFPVIETGFFKDWKLVQIEGEDAIDSSMEHASTGKAPSGKSAPPKKPADNKKGGPGKPLEEITDNRPRIIKYEHDFAELNNGEGLLVNEIVARKFANAFINV